MQILLETNEYMVINKPAGMAVHGDGKSDQYTVADWLMAEYPDIRDVGEPMEVEVAGEAGKFLKKIFRPGIVHRLDKDTTGCLLIAKTQAMYLFLKKQFQDHTIEKIYHAFVYGSIKDTDICVTDSIGRSRSNIRMWAVGNTARGELRHAETTFHVIHRIGVEDDKASTEKGTYTFVECRPKTGRTHQIRVHLRSINHPIVGDTLYGGKRVLQDHVGCGFNRLALHARSIAFTDTNGDTIQVVAPYPPDFEHAVNSIAKKN